MLTVITGSMFAEKSTELQRRGKRFARAGKKVTYFKPQFDNRYSENEIVTHDGMRVKAVNIKEDSPESILMKRYESDVYLIDEVQFFSKEIYYVVKELLLRGDTVIVAGLDMDYKGEPFAVTITLMGIAEEVVKLKAVCSSCGRDGWVSHKEDNNQRIELGTDEYSPMCRKCYNNLKGGN